MRMSYKMQIDSLCCSLEGQMNYEEMIAQREERAAAEREQACEIVKRLIATATLSDEDREALRVLLR